MQKHPLKPALARVEADLIKSALESTGGDVRAAARLLDVPERTLWRRMKKLGISRVVEIRDTNVIAKQQVK